MKYYVMIGVLMVLPLLAACNTVEGLGQDMQQGGAALEESADNSK